MTFEGWRRRNEASEEDGIATHDLSYMFTGFEAHLICLQNQRHQESAQGHLYRIMLPSLGVLIARGDKAKYSYAVWHEL